MSVSPIKIKPAFSMLEVIFVIVILGIVASIGSQIIVQVYESYITQRAVHRSSIKTELAATQLANRLAYSIPNTIIGRKADNVTFQAIEHIPIGIIDYTTLEWISYDADSFGAVTDTTIPTGRKPVWSGYADVLDSTIDTLSTPGSRLSKLGAIIDALAPSSKNVSNTAILFPNTYNAGTIGFAGNIGISTTVASSDYDIHPVSAAPDDDTLTLDATTDPSGERTIKEHYKLAWTAYAVVPTELTNAEKEDRGFKTADNIYDLRLYYDYQPWDGDSFSDGSNVVLIRSISVFKFTGSGDTIRFKICQREAIGETFTTTTCKEKAVIR